MALDLGIGIPGLFAGGNYIQGESGNILDVTEIGQMNISGSVIFPSAQDVTIGNAYLEISGSVVFSDTQNVQFPSAQSVQFDSAQDVTIDNAVLDISGSIIFQDTQDVNITTPELDINLSGSNITLDVFTTGANIEQHKVNVISGASVTQTWTAATKSFIFYNDGSGTVHINFDGAATTNHFPIKSKQTFAIDLATQDTRFISDISGSTLYALGMY